PHLTSLIFPYPTLFRSKALYFDWNDLAAFDLFILKREQAGQDYPEAVRTAAEKRYQSYTSQQVEELSTNILMGIPGERNIGLSEDRKSTRLNSSHVKIS